MDKRKEYGSLQDPQQAEPVERCPRCGREVYGSEGGCLYCQTYNI